MRRSIEFVILGLTVVLSMGASCRQETAQSVFFSFLTELAVSVADAIVAAFVNS